MGQQTLSAEGSTTNILGFREHKVAAITIQPDSVKAAMDDVQTNRSGGDLIKH